jgi:4-alpha-glucanotransferase
MESSYDEWGIADGYHDIAGAWHPTPDATRELLRSAMGRAEVADPLWFVPVSHTPAVSGPCTIVLERGDEIEVEAALPAGLPSGYHWLHPADDGPATRLIVHPERCRPSPAAWGVAAQIYSMWRPDAWGIGDLRDVVALAQAVGERGGEAVLLSPLHAPAPTMPQEPSPYYPSSRRWLSPLLVPVDAPRPDFVPNAPGGTIDRDAVWRAKRTHLAGRFALERDDPAWRAWSRAQGHELWSYASWNALADVHGPHWQEWPAELRHPSSTLVADLPLIDRGHAERCEFHAWCQFVTHRELQDAAVSAGIGLIGDLAVGSSPDGADAWIHQDLLALDVRIGAPPDSFNEDGQEWGLPPFVPSRLRARHYQPFIAMVRAALRSMAGLRIDHVMGLFRQYWVPLGHAPSDGAYVRLPAAELLAIICLECERAGAFVVGEDLGTVEPEVHAAMSACGMSGTKVWWFDTSVSSWPTTSLGTVTTHDLPTVAGVWMGTDGTAEMREQLAALVDPGSTVEDAAVAVHRAVAKSPARLTLASLDDLAGTVVRPNLPGTWGEGTVNWSVRLGDTPADIVSSPLASRIIAALAEPAS